MNTVEKKELDLILASDGFRGKKLRKALTVLCESHWSGDEEVNTQYDLAEKLYGSTEEEKTVLVRNLISRLRTKLNEFYANNGNGNGVRVEIPVGEYRVIFRPVESRSEADNIPPPGNTPDELNLDEGQQNFPARDTKRPARVLVPLVAIPLLVLLGLWWVSSNSPNEAITSEASVASPANDLRAEGNLVRCFGASGDRELWVEKFPAQVVQAASFDTSPSPNRFFVLYGGTKANLDQVWHPPSVRILSGSGKKLADINLLDNYNPFKGMYSDELFYNPSLEAIADIDQDGSLDLLLETHHLYYPAILFMISGRTLECTYAFANSGYFFEVAVSKKPVANSNRLAIGTLAVNNRMAGQFALIYLPYEAGFFRHSPNPELPDEMTYAHYRPIEFLHFATNSLTFDEQNNLQLDTGSSILRMNYSGILDTDDCWEEPGRHAHRSSNRVGFQRMVKQAWEQAQSDEEESAALLFRDALQRAEDQATRCWVRMEAARTLLEAGAPEQALMFLPDDIDAQPDPLRFHQLEGDIHMVGGERTLAQRSYEAASDVACQACTDSMESFVHAVVLNGADQVEVHQKLYDRYYGQLTQAAPQAWLLLPLLLRDECQSPAEAVLESFNLPDLDPAFTEPYSSAYPEEAEIIHAFYNLAQAVEPTVWPDREVTLTAPFEYGDVFWAKIALLDAVRMEAEQGPVAALDELRDAYLVLEDLSRGNARAVVWYVLAAYQYGFAAVEAGEIKAGRMALRAAVDRYPWGSRAELAQRHLR